VTVTDDKRSAWLQKLDEECPYQVVLPRRQLMENSAIMDFLLSYVGKFAAAIPRSRLVVIRDCGHMSTLERPQAVTDALVEWYRAP
jgi:hypothetical protein